MTASLSVSIVSYDPRLETLGETLRSLSASLGRARGADALREAAVALVDNGPNDRFAAALRALAERAVAPEIVCEVLTGHGNVGYGRAHNMALLASDAEYHLVLNPDVTLDPEAIEAAVGYMKAHPDVVILAPEARDAQGTQLYLCKRYPSVLDLALRGFAPPWVKRAFAERLARYEMRDLPRNVPSAGIPIVSGSFMFCRRAPIAEIGGFSDAFFLYFEDFDLSLRAAAKGTIAFVPTVRMVHHGGHAARKGARHVGLFMRSAATFFGRHGWKWL